MSEILGLGLDEAKVEEVILDDEVKELVNARKLARETKDFGEADRLRDLLGEKGFLVKDTADGQQVSKKSL